MRRDDPKQSDFQHLREAIQPPDERIVVKPGTVVIPTLSLGLFAVVGSAVAVTLHDPIRKRGGMAHFLRALPDNGDPSTALYGLPACVALLRQLLGEETHPQDLCAGIYGGAYPEQATVKMREISRANVMVARDVMAKKGIPVTDEDVGGHRGRKLLFFPATNEIAILRTDQVRKSDWFEEPMVYQGGNDDSSVGGR